MKKKPSEPKLTPREQQALALLAFGWPDKRIASKLGVSFSRAQKLMGALLQKLNCESRAGLAFLYGQRRRKNTGNKTVIKRAYRQVPQKS